MTGETQQSEEKAQDQKESPAEPQTMESLLAEQSELQEKLGTREVVWVKIVSIDKDQVLVDIGEKSEGVIPLSEFEADQPPKPGRKVPAVLIKRGGGDRPAQLSTQRARASLGWEQVLKARDAKERVRGKVLSSVKGGFLVEVFGVTGFMPASLADLRPVRKPEALIGSGVRCVILELDQAKNQLILSRRAVLEEDAKVRREKLLGELKTGQVRVGRINRIGEQGLFVDIGGMEGLVHTPDIAWKDPEAAKKGFERGQKIRVRVLTMDAATGKVGLGIKQLMPHPADALRKRYAPKAVVKGTVTEVLKEGVRLSLAKGDPGFCSVEELPLKPGEVEEPADLFDRRERDHRDHRERRARPPVNPEKLSWPKQGESVTAVVLGVLNSTFEVGVSIRRYEAIQDRKRAQHYMKEAPPLTLGQLLNPEE